MKPRQHDAPLHPVQALARRHQCIGWIEFNILNSPIQPAQAGMIAIGKALALLDHRPRTIDRIQPLNTVYKIACDITDSAAHIEDMSRFSLNEFHQDIEDLRWIGRTMAVGLHNAAVLKWFRIFGGPLFWFVEHLCQTPLSVE